MPILQIGEWTVSTDLNTLKSDQVQLQIEPKAMRLLLLLAENAGHLVSKEQILETVWGDLYVSDSVLWHTVSDLRRLLGDDSQHPRYIETVPKGGYRLAADVSISKSPDSEDRKGPYDSLLRALMFRSGMEAEGIRPPRTPVILTWVLVATLATSCAVLAVFYFGQTTNPAPETLRFNIGPPDGTSFILTNPFGGSPAISPDGHDVAFAAESGGRTRLYVHNLADNITLPIAGTDDASFPFWSPDSQYIGFFARGRLWTVHISGHPIQPVCDAHFGLGGTWNTDGTIIFARDFYGSLFQVSSDGGVPEPLSSLNKDRAELSHRWPYMLPDGQSYIYSAVSSESRFSGIFVGRLDSATPKMILRDASNVQYSVTGHLYFLREGVLMAQSFDLEDLVTQGNPEVIIRKVAFSPGFSLGIFSVSDSGLLVYSAVSEVQSSLSRISGDGDLMDSLNGTADTERFDLAPDSINLILDRPNPGSGESDLWLWNADDSPPQILTDGTSVDSFPIWSPDATQIVFSSTRDGTLNLYTLRLLDNQVELLLESSNELRAQDWSNDGRYIIYERTHETTKSDLWILPLDRTQEPMPFLASENSEYHAQFSPDGRWIAYTSDQTHRREVYLKGFPPSQGTWQISTQGGYQPRWSEDGHSIYYISAERDLMRVSLDLEDENARVEKPEQLFPVQIGDLEAAPQYAVLSAGNGFLVNKLMEATGQLQISVLFRALQ